MTFVDTSFWIAVHDRSDDRHKRAAELLRERGRDGLITTDHVRGETWTFLRKRSGHAVAVRFLDALAASENVRVAFVGEELENEALEWLRKHDERPYSFTDATSFAVMRSLSVDRALSFDDDFSVAGFVTLR